MTRTQRSATPATQGKIADQGLQRGWSGDPALFQQHRTRQGKAETRIGHGQCRDANLNAGRFHDKIDRQGNPRKRIYHPWRIQQSVHANRSISFVVGHSSTTNFVCLGESYLLAPFLRAIYDVNKGDEATGPRHPLCRRSSPGVAYTSIDGRIPLQPFSRGNCGTSVCEATIILSGNTMQHYQFEI